MEIKEWDMSGIFGWVREINECLEIYSCLVRTQNAEFAYLWLQVTEASAPRDGCKFVSFGAVELVKWNGF